MKPFVLLHSPLVGTLTWQPVREQLLKHGYTVFTPEFKDTPESTTPYWQQHVQSLDLPIEDAILVGHSAAGALLPTLGEKFNVYGYIFVDAVLLFEPATRLDLLRREDADFTAQFEANLESGEQFPNWQDEHLVHLIPDAQMRQKLLDDVRPRSLGFFQERIEVPHNWTKRPCAYLQLSKTYDTYATQAEVNKWLVIREDAHHFQMLTEPASVTEQILTLANQL